MSDQPSPAKIMQIATGHWASRILNSAVEFEVFRHLEAAPATAAELAERAAISPRGAQALLDGALGLGLVTKEGDAYRNGDEAATFLVKGKPTYLGFAGMASLDWSEWADLDQAIRTGTTPHDETSYEIEDFDFWETLVTAIGPLAAPIADGVAERLGLAEAGGFRMLDVGGGSGIYSATWLGHNAEARAIQLDWPNVNQVARKLVGERGVGDRFETVDGNLLEVDFGDAAYDFGVFSHMAHGLSAEQNRAVMAKFRKAIKPGGTLVVADFILDDQRQGHPMALLFYANMLHATAAGRTYTEGEYRSWLNGAGFAEVEFQSFAPSPVSVAYGR